MTQDDIIRMADASGLSYYGMGKDREKFLHYLAAFAALVAAQPEQEVSCRFCHDKKGCWAWQCYHCGEIDDVQKPAPPAAQHPWQGLTEFQFAEIYNAWNDTNGSTPWGLNQALEAKLRNLNK